MRREDITCDLCGKSCKKFETEDGGAKDFEYATLTASWGYWSDNKDMDRWECHICEECCDKLPFRDKIRVYDEYGKLVGEQHDTQAQADSGQESD